MLKIGFSLHDKATASELSMSSFSAQCWLLSSKASNMPPAFSPH